MTQTDATTELSIDGIAPEAIAAPESADELAAILGHAAVDGATVVPVGGGTALGLGNVPERVDLAIDTRGLSRVLAYEPFDLTLSVEAGATIASIQSVLGEHGQELPIEVPFPERATIGGVVATGYAGPLRLGNGTLRDLLIGAGFACSDGTLAKSGGMVVKNVSGFDLARLMHGALGTLGVLTSLNLKVLPSARADRTLLVDGAPAKQVEAALAACLLPLRPAAIELVLDGASHRLAIRLRGRSRGVEEQTGSIRRLLADRDLAVTAQFEDRESSAWWQTLLNHWGVERADLVQLQLKDRPRNAGKLIEGLRQAVSDHGAGCEAICSPGLGLARFALPVPATDTATWLRSTQQRWLRDGEDVVVQFSPPQAKRGLDVWGRAPSGLTVMRSLKAELDPSGALNRGRFVGFI